MGNRNTSPFECDHKEPIIENINDTLMNIAIPLLLASTEALKLRVQANLFLK